MVEFNCEVASAYGEKVNSSLSILNEARSHINSGVSHYGYLGSGSCSLINNVESLCEDLKGFISESVSIYSEFLQTTGTDLQNLETVYYLDAATGALIYIYDSPLVALRNQFGNESKITHLDGDAFEDYCKKALIGPDDYWGLGYFTIDEEGNEVYNGTLVGDELTSRVTIDLDVYVVNTEVNGVPLEFAYVYDKTKDIEHHRQFEEWASIRMEEIESIPGPILSEIVSRNPLIIKVNETEVCDSHSTIVETPDELYVDYYSGGYSTNSNGINVVTANYCSWWDENYYSGMYLHEMGHAYDQYSLTENSAWSGITEQEVNTFLETFAPTDTPTDWSLLSSDEQKNLTVENFANCFREYIRNPEALEFACPEAYEMIDSHFQNTISNNSNQ